MVTCTSRGSVDTDTHYMWLGDAKSVKNHEASVRLHRHFKVLECYA